MGDEQNDGQLGLSVNFVHKNTLQNVMFPALTGYSPPLPT